MAIGSIIGAGLGAIGSIFGGIKASQAMRKVRDNINAEKADNEAWYNAEYYNDATQRADAQRAIQMTMDDVRKRNQQARAMQAVAGGTDASVAVEKAANNQAIADTMSSIAADAANRKDEIQQQYRQTKSALNANLNNMELNKAQAITQATQGVVGAGSKIAEALG